MYTKWLTYAFTILPSFQITCETTGWVGLGLSPNGGMAGADIAIGWVTAGSHIRSHSHTFLEVSLQGGQGLSWWCDGVVDAGHLETLRLVQWASEITPGTHGCPGPVLFIAMYLIVLEI